MDKSALKQHLKNAAVKDKYAIIRELCRDRRVLDVGCIGQDVTAQKGNWLHDIIRKVASGVTGVDISKENIEKFNQAGYHMLHTSQLAESKETYDIVIMADVIEHVNDPVGFLQFYEQFLNDTGIMVISTPNANRAINFFSILFLNNYSVNEEHTCWFCPRTLHEVIVRSGLSLKEFYWLKRYYPYTGLSFVFKGAYRPFRYYGKVPKTVLSEFYGHCMQMKVGIFTPYNPNPVHPRTEMYLSCFSHLKIEATVEPLRKKDSRALSFFSKLLINMFDLNAVGEMTREIRKYDCILIQDLKFLPLAIYAKRKGKKVVYETLDNSVFIRVHNQKKNFLYPLIWLLTPVFSGIEKAICKMFTDRVIVNSLTLEKRFGQKAALILYSSPFEVAGIRNIPGKKPAFLYLGAISIDKGIDDILSLIGQFQLQAFLFGDCQSIEVEARIKNNPLITWKPRINSNALTHELELLTGNYFLIGISLIKPVHHSYATQEANKEIDYMAMGIPFIGNHRLTTREKIIAGCGVFLDEPKEISKLVDDVQYQSLKSLNCMQLYGAHYAVNQFFLKVAFVFKER